MRKNILKTGLLAALVLGLTAVLFTGCDDIVPLSARDRMVMFITDTNIQNWAGLKQHTHPDAAAYNTANAALWSTEFEPFLTLVGPVMGGNNATVTGSGGTPVFSFALKEDGKKNFKIFRIINVTDGNRVIFQ